MSDEEFKKISKTFEEMEKLNVSGVIVLSSDSDVFEKTGMNLKSNVAQIYDKPITKKDGAAFTIELHSKNADDVLYLLPVNVETRNKVLEAANNDTLDPNCLDARLRGTVIVVSEDFVYTHLGGK